MKKIVFLIILLIIQINIFGQQYIPFNFENGIWICYEGLFGGEPLTYKIQYYTDGDTNINGNNYSRLMEYRINTESGPGYGSVVYDGYKGAIRNLDNKQVEFIWRTHDEPQIIYDFNLLIGDTIKIGYGSDQYIGNGEFLKIISIDSILFCGNYHKRYNLNDSLFFPQSLIEGIGFNSGFIEPYFYQFEQNSNLICYTEINNNDCENCELLLSNKILELNSKIEIFPNPNSGFLNIKSDKYIIEYNIVNNLGQTIIARNNLYNKDLTLNTNLTNGIYLLKIKIIDQKIYTNKIIIQK